MEEKKFYEKSVYHLAKWCGTVIREKAPACPTLMSRKGGVFRLDICPAEGSDGAQFRKWLGIPGDYPYEAECLQLVYRIFPGWDFKIWCDEGDEHGWVDCAAYAEMKAASCSIRLAEGVGFDSGPIPGSAGCVFRTADEWGFAEHKGAIVFVITERGNYQKVLGEIYVIISGGTQREDEMLAKSTATVINDFFKDDPGAEILPASRHPD